MTLQDVIKWCKENGKAIVLDEGGKLQLVVLGAEEYRKLSDKHFGKLPARPGPLAEDIERINREIIQAQLKGEGGKNALNQTQIIRRVGMSSQVMEADQNAGSFSEGESEAIKPGFDDI